MIFLYGIWTADDPTIIYMMNICKYSSMAFSYEDGEKEDTQIKSSHLRRIKITEKPTLLETFSFSFYFPSAVIGPSFEYKDFHNFIYMKDCYARIPYLWMIIYGFVYLVVSILMMAFYGFIGSKYPLTYCGTVEYGQQSILYQLLYVNLGMTFHRSKFYCGWLLSYSGFIFSGLAYTELPIQEASIPTLGDDTPSLNYLPQDIEGIEKSFKKGEYGSIIDCELGINPKTKITSWNHVVHLWMKYNIFIRLIALKGTRLENNAQLCSLITFMLSAFWHGFYPTYYIGFFLYFVFQTANEKVDKIGFFTWARKNYGIKFLVWIFSQYVSNTLGVIIFNLKWRLFKQYMKNTYGAPV